MTLKARVENGKLIADAPAEYPEGSIVELEIVDFEEEMTPEEIAELNRDIEESEREIAAGHYVPIEEVLAELRARR